MTTFKLTRRKQCPMCGEASDDRREAAEHTAANLQEALGIYKHKIEELERELEQARQLAQAAANDAASLEKDLCKATLTVETWRGRAEVAEAATRGAQTLGVEAQHRAEVAERLAAKATTAFGEVCASSDAALEEISEVRARLTERLEVAERERDEARGQVAALRKELARGPHREGCSMWGRVKEGETVSCTCSVGKTLSNTAQSAADFEKRIREDQIVKTLAPYNFGVFETLRARVAQLEEALRELRYEADSHNVWQVGDDGEQVSPYLAIPNKTQDKVNAALSGDSGKWLTGRLTKVAERNRPSEEE